jgi:hypothetical protein
LDCGCQVELLSDVPQSSQSCLAQLNLLLGFGEQSFDLVTCPLGKFVLRRTRQRTNIKLTYYREFLQVDSQKNQTGTATSAVTALLVEGDDGGDFVTSHSIKVGS